MQNIFNIPTHILIEITIQSWYFYAKCHCNHTEKRSAAQRETLCMRYFPPNSHGPILGNSQQTIEIFVFLGCSVAEATSNEPHFQGKQHHILPGPIILFPVVKWNVYSEWSLGFYVIKSHVRLLISAALVFFTLTAVYGQSTPPVWPDCYVVRGMLRLPYAELEEPFTAYYETKKNRSRIDYYGIGILNFYVFFVVLSILMLAFSFITR